MTGHQFTCPLCGATLHDEADRERHLAAEHPEPGDALDNDQARIDEAERESFPASDPPAYTPVQGIGAPAADPREDAARLDTEP
ncbi:MAG: hypothetical protein WC211_02525 [Dehalococcoidia bacterium]